MQHLSAIVRGYLFALLGHWNHRYPCPSCPATRLSPNGGPMAWNNFRKDADWNWTPECETAWLTLKRKLMTFPVLRIFDPKLKTVLYTDSSKHHLIVWGKLCLDHSDYDLAIIVACSHPQSA